jgi:hypothetical protein
MSRFQSRDLSVFLCQPVLSVCTTEESVFNESQFSPYITMTRNIENRFKPEPVLRLYLSTPASDV